VTINASNEDIGIRNSTVNQLYTIIYQQSITSISPTEILSKKIYVCGWECEPVYMVRTTVVFAAALLAGIHILAGNKPRYSYIKVVRHVTGNDKDYLRKIPRVVW
jgi:hypothetical protein